MKTWSSVEEVLDFAICEEEGAVKFYTRLAEQVNNVAMRYVFEDFAREEKGHKKKLLAVKAGKSLEQAGQAVQDLKIADYLVDIKPSPDMTYIDALIVAMKKEKTAFKLYNDLAAATKDENIKKVFLELAQEEAKHKLRFEIEYDDSLTDN
ncbi:ferritin family protein [Candidatus Latescibacterota bacterium]